MWPSGATSATWHVINNALLSPPGLRLDRRELWLSGESSGLADNVCIFPSRTVVLVAPSRSNCKCSSVWCDLRHFWCFCSEPHCGVKWPDCGKFRVITKVMFPYEVSSLRQCQTLKFLTYIKWVFPNTARDASWVNVRHVRCFSLSVALRSFIVNRLRGPGSKINKFQIFCVCVCLCHLNIIALPSFISTNDVTNGPDGS